MTADVAIKICGIASEAAVDAVNAIGAAMVGFNFVHRSVRCVTPARARELAERLAPSIRPVALVVDADDAALAEIVAEAAPAMLQLHGAETPARVAHVRSRFGLPVIKALPVADAADIDRAAAYEGVADWLLFDAKPPKSRPGALSGGNGLAFDWHLIAGRAPATAWMLSGGLTPENVAAAIAVTGARAVDVASGVERAPGDKDPRLIEAFAAAVRAAG